jgi:hypothetical protein
VVREEWRAPAELLLVGDRDVPADACAFMAESELDLDWLVENAAGRPGLRAVIAPHIPSSVVAALSDLGVLVLRADPENWKALSQTRAVGVPAPSAWQNGDILLTTSDASIRVEWLARGRERGAMAQGRAAGGAS